MKLIKIALTEDAFNILKTTLLPLLSTVELLMGEQFSVDIKDQAEGRPVGDRSEPRVQYRALVEDSRILHALGDQTVKGIIYGYLLSNGPKTVKDIIQYRGFTDKSVQSAIHQLRNKGLVEAEPVPHAGEEAV